MKVYGLFHDSFESKSLIKLYLSEESAIEEKQHLHNLPSIWEWRESPEMENLDNEAEKLREEFAKYPRFKSKKDEENKMKTDPHYRSITEQWSELNKKRQYPHPPYAGPEQELRVIELDVL